MPFALRFVLAAPFLASALAFEAVEIAASWARWALDETVTWIHDGHEEGDQQEKKQ